MDCRHTSVSLQGDGTWRCVNPSCHQPFIPTSVAAARPQVAPDVPPRVVDMRNVFTAEGLRQHAYDRNLPTGGSRTEVAFRLYHAGYRTWDLIAGKMKPSHPPTPPEENHA